MPKRYLETRPCACGCQEIIRPEWDYKRGAYSQFKHGHHNKFQEYKLSDEQEQELIEAYLSGLFLEELLQRFDIGCTTLYRILKRNSVPSLWKNRKTNYQEDSNFFNEIDTEAKAYWLGFIAADGCVQDNDHCKSLAIGLHSRDAEHIEKFKKDIQSTRPIRHCNYAGKPSTNISISDRQIVADLIRHGICPRKSWNLEFPTTVQDPFLCHFLRGYFDGDGHVDISNNRLNFDLAGTFAFLQGAQDVLTSHCDLNFTKLHESTASKTTFYLVYNGNRQVFRILQYLYGNCTVYLTRKGDFIIDLLNGNRVCKMCGRQIILGDLCGPCQSSLGRCPRTAQEELLICQRYLNGETLKTLEATTRFSETAIRRMLKLHEVPIRPRGHYPRT